MGRLTIDTDQNLNELVRMTGGTKVDVILKALATYKYLKTEDQDPSNKVSITNGNDEVLKDITLP